MGLFALVWMGRAVAALPAMQGAASVVYNRYMSEWQRRSVGKAARPEGLLLSDRHAALRTLAIVDYGAAARALPAGHSEATRPIQTSVNRPS